MIEREEREEVLLSYFFNIDLESSRSVLTCFDLVNSLALIV